MTRPEALTALLLLPPDEDGVRKPSPIPQDLLLGGHRIGYHYTLGRTPLRDPELIKRDLGVAYVTWRRQLWTGGDSVVSVRRRRLQIVRRA